MIESHTCLVNGVCDYCIGIYPNLALWEELGIRVELAFEDEQTRVNGDHVWLKARASGNEWTDSSLFWQAIGVST